MRRRRDRRLPADQYETAIKIGGQDLRGLRHQLLEDVLGVVGCS
ncbi:hypothetical protein [Patulibacter americanus]|nr:hypothetical protein [Patulibacter americanus]